jgi:glycosyltransferase involved in cell wall biosynthesis
MEILFVVKISVVIPVYNRAEWIGQTLDRIFNQKHDVFEVVICDDGSTDALAEALHPYGTKIKLITIANSGPGIARKTAINHTSGNWVALCDSDDFWHEDHIQNFVDALTAYPGTGAFNRSRQHLGQPIGWAVKGQRFSGAIV